MREHSLNHLADEALIHDLKTLVANDLATTAAIVARVSEVDARRLFRPIGYPSMFQYSIQELGMSEDVAWKRVTAARLARRFPGIATPTTLIPDSLGVQELASKRQKFTPPRVVERFSRTANEWADCTPA